MSADSVPLAFESRRLRLRHLVPTGVSMAAKKSTVTKRTKGRATTRATTRATFVAAQRHADRNDAKARRKNGKSKSQQPAAMSEPTPPYPRQHQSHPGIEAKITPRPRYEGAAYRPAGKLEGKTALITGGDSGIGRAVTVFFAREGADVAIVYLAEEQQDAEDTRRAVESFGHQCLLIPGDVTSSTFCTSAVNRAALTSAAST